MTRIFSTVRSSRLAVAVNALALLVILASASSPCAADPGAVAAAPALNAQQGPLPATKESSAERNSEVPSGPPALLPRVGVFGEAPITLKEAIARVLANNNDIEASRIDQQISEYDVTAAEGAFDLRFGAQTELLRANTPVSSSLGGSASGSLTQRDFSVTPQIGGSIPWTGASFQVDMVNNRLTTDNEFTTLNPQFPTSLRFSFAQPLARGLLFDDNRRRIDVAKKNQALSDEQFRQRVIDTVTQAAQAYWDLAFAVRNLEIQNEAMTLARRQVESNERMATQGILAPIDVVEAQTQLSTFEQNVYAAQDTLTRAENALKALMLPGRSDPLWSSALTPVTPPNVWRPKIPLRDAVDEAISRRPELAGVKISSSINHTNTRYFHEETKPQVDLVASYTSAGLAGRTIPSQVNPLTAGFVGVFQRLDELSAIQGLPALPPISFGGGGGVPEVLVGSYSQSLSNLFNRNFTTVSGGLQISLPLRNRTAEGNHAASLAEGRRIETQRRQLEQSIEADVRNAMQAVESAEARHQAARNERASAVEQYESEQRKFQAGTSTVFLVLQRQTGMIAARSREVRAEADLSKAIAQFDRARAATLETYEIQIESGPGGRP